MDFAKEQECISCDVYFVRKKFFVTFVVYLNVLCTEWTLSISISTHTIYIYIHIRWLLLTTKSSMVIAELGSKYASVYDTVFRITEFSE